MNEETFEAALVPDKPITAEEYASRVEMGLEQFLEDQEEDELKTQAEWQEVLLTFIHD